MFQKIIELVFLCIVPRVDIYDANKGRLFVADDPIDFLLN
jgi:hypothetical protein